MIAVGTGVFVLTNLWTKQVSPIWQMSMPFCVKISALCIMFSDLQMIVYK